MQLVLNMTAQIKEMENQTETLMKENETLIKENEVSTPTIIPMATTVVPSTLADHLAPKGVFTTAVSITSIDTSATGSSTSQVHQEKGTTDIVKSMEEMSLKNTEINNLKKENKDLESSYKNALITYKGHEQRENRLQEQVNILLLQVNLSE